MSATRTVLLAVLAVAMVLPTSAEARRGRRSGPSTAVERSSGEAKPRPRRALRGRPRRVRHVHPWRPPPHETRLAAPARTQAPREARLEASPRPLDLPSHATPQERLAAIERRLADLDASIDGVQATMSDLKDRLLGSGAEGPPAGTLGVRPGPSI